MAFKKNNALKEKKTRMKILNISFSYQNWTIGREQTLRPSDLKIIISIFKESLKNILLQ